MPEDLPPPVVVNGIAFTSEGKLTPKPTGYEHKKLTPRYPTFAGREPNFRSPFERISRLQIPLTRGKKGLKRNSAFKRSRQPDLMALLVRRKAPAAVVELVCRPSQASAADTSL
jgi:hypothetical protein